MSFGIKLAITIVALAVLAWGFVNYSQQQPMAGENDAAMQDQNAMPAQQPTPTTAAQAVSARGTSDANLEADLQDIDAQTQVAVDSSTAADKGLNDKSGDVSY